VIEKSPNNLIFEFAVFKFTFWAFFASEKKADKKRNKVVMRFSIILIGSFRGEGKMVSMSKDMAKELSTRFGS